LLHQKDTIFYLSEGPLVFIKTQLQPSIGSSSSPISGHLGVLAYSPTSCSIHTTISVMLKPTCPSFLAACFPLIEPGPTLFIQRWCKLTVGFLFERGMKWIVRFVPHGPSRNAELKKLQPTRRERRTQNIRRLSRATRPRGGRTAALYILTYVPLYPPETACTIRDLYTCPHHKVGGVTDGGWRGFFSFLFTKGGIKAAFVAPAGRVLGTRGGFINQKALHIGGGGRAVNI